MASSKKKQGAKSQPKAKKSALLRDLAPKADPKGGFAYGTLKFGVDVGSS